MHPHIFVTAEKIEGLRSVEDIRQGIRGGPLAALWELLLKLADADVEREPYLPTSAVPGRPQLDIGHENRDWTLINAVVSGSSDVPSPT